MYQSKDLLNGRIDCMDFDYKESKKKIIYIHSSKSEIKEVDNQPLKLFKDVRINL